MNLRRLVLAAGVIAAVSWPGALAEARQAGPRQGPGLGLRAGPPALTPGELERWMDSYELLQAQETLKLGDEQFPRFVQRLKVLQEVRRRNLQARRQALGAIGALLRATPPDQAQLRERLRALHELDVRSFAATQKAYAGLDEVLDAAQQARFRLFEAALDRRKIDLLMRARQRAGARGPGGPPGL